MRYIVTLNDEKYEVEVDGVNAILNPETDEPATFSAASAVPLQRSVQQDIQLAVHEKTVGEGMPIKSPLQGKVVDINVSVGDPVKSGETVALIEAMKMENEIKTGITGIVTSVAVTKGSSVNADDVLLTIK